MFIEPEIPEIGKDERFIEAIDQCAVHSYFQFILEPMADELAFPAGFAKVAGGFAGRGGLPHGGRCAAEAIFAVAPVTDYVAHFAGESHQTCLDRHVK